MATAEATARAEADRDQALKPMPAGISSEMSFALPGGWAKLRASPGQQADLRILAPDWPEPSPDNRTSKPSVRLDTRHTTTGWCIDGPDVITPDQRYGAGFELANGLVGALTACYLVRNNRMLCLHAAAVQARRGLVVLLGQNFAGKSTLATALAAQGMRLFCDDRLLVEWTGAPTGLSLGSATKLRRPLPASADRAMHDFVDLHTVWKTPEFAILDGPDSARARFGSRCALAGVVILDRQEEDVVPTLSRISKPQAVTALLRQHFAPHLATAELLQACTAIATAIPGWTFSYSGCSDAAAALRLALARDGVE